MVESRDVQTKVCEKGYTTILYVTPGMIGCCPEDAGKERDNMCYEISMRNAEQECLGAENVKDEEEQLNAVVDNCLDEEWETCGYCLIDLD